MNAAAHAGARFPSALIDRIRLADGREVVVRPVLAIDAEAEQAFVRGLSLESRRKRFHLPIRELSPALLRQLTDVDHVGHVAIVAESLSGDDVPTIVADARYVKEGAETHFAIAVADAWQNAGLGRAMTRRLLRYAERRGIARLVADMKARRDDQREHRGPDRPHESAPPPATRAPLVARLGRLHALAQFFSSAKQARHDRAGRHSDDFGNFFRGALLHVIERQHFTVVDRQGVHGVFERLPLLPRNGARSFPLLVTPSI